MRGLIRSALALFAMGAAVGCNNPPNQEDAGPAKVDAPFEATFRVPGMS